MKTILVAATMAISASSALAQAPSQKPWAHEPDSVLSVKFGRPLSETGLPPCPAGNVERLCISELWLGEKPTTYLRGTPFPNANIIVHTANDGNVSVIQAAMKHPFFGTFYEVLVERYGPPTTRTNSTAKTLGGAELPSFTAMWIGSHMTITAHERYDRVDDSMVFFTSNDEANKNHEASRKAIRDAASKL